MANETITIDGIVAEISVEDYAKGKSLIAPPWRNVSYVVDYADSDAFMDALLGFTQPTVPGQAPGRKPPHQYPDEPLLYCVDTSCTPLGTPSPGAKLLTAPKSLVRARYEVPRFDVAGFDTNNAVSGQAMPFSSWDVAGRTQIVHMPGVKATSGVKAKKPFKLRVLREEVTVQFEWVPYIYLNVYRLYAKSVNDAVFLDWAVGCVLFDEYTLSRTLDSVGNVVQRLRLLFLAQSVDWNTMPKEDDLDYQPVEGEANAAPPYPYRNLMDLLS